MLRLYHAPFTRSRRRRKQLLQGPQRGAIHMGKLGWFHPTARVAIEHPFRNLQDGKSLEAHRARSAEQHSQLCVPRHEPTPVAHATDASGTGLLEKRFYGCFVPRLYNHGRPHSSLGPGIPDLRSRRQAKPCGHRIPVDHQVVTKAILGGLHHEYRLERRVA